MSSGLYMWAHIHVHLHTHTVAESLPFALTVCGSPGTGYFHITVPKYVTETAEGKIYLCSSFQSCSGHKKEDMGKGRKATPCAAVGEQGVGCSRGWEKAMISKGCPPDSFFR